MKIALLLLLLSAGCMSYKASDYTPQTITIKGSYAGSPYSAISDKPVDSVWSNIIDIFSLSGIGIKTIDKSSGLIVSEKASISYTVEKDSGQLANPKAYVVTEWMKSPKMTWMPSHVTCEWNVRVKPNNGGTFISINITNIDATLSGLYNTTRFKAQSTGVFEKMIAEQIK